MNWRYRMVSSVAVVALLTVATFTHAVAAANLQDAENALYRGQTVEVFRTVRALTGPENPERTRRDGLILQGRLYLALADGDKAQAALEQASLLAEKLGDAAPLATVLNGQARLDLLRTRYDRAEMRLSRALALAEKGGSTRVLAETLTAQSELLRRQGDLSAALASIQRALSLAREHHDEHAHALAVAQRAELETYQASYRSALDSWQEAIRGFQKLGYTPTLGSAISSLGQVEFELGLLRESVGRFEEALKIARQFSDPVGEVRARNQLGRAYLRLKQPERARDFAETALELARRRHDYVGEAESLVQLGELWLGDPVPSLPALPSPAVAIKHLRNAIDVYRSAGDRAGEARTFLKIGAAYLLSDQYRTAARVFDSVTETASKNGDDDTLWQALRGGAVALQAANDRQGAAVRYGEAVKVLERVYARTAGLDQDLRSAFLGEKRGLYEDYVRLLVGIDTLPGTDPKTTAFEISELARSRQFSEMLARAGVEQALARGDPRLRTLLERERLLRLELAQTLRALLATQRVDSAAQTRTLQDRIATLSASHHETRAQVAREFPGLAELTEPRPITVPEVQRGLATDETLLAYFVTQRTLVIFVVTRDRFHAEQIVLSRTELRRLVERFRGPFLNLRSANDLRKWSPAAAAELYARVIAPVADRLPGKGKLLIAGDDALHTLPFEALVRSAPAVSVAPGQPLFSEYAKLEWFGDQYQIAYLPAAGILRQLRETRQRASTWRQTLVAFADPNFGDDAVDGNLSARGGLFGTVLSRATGSAGLARLPETADEARAVAKTLGGSTQVLLRGDASEARLYGMDLEGTRYLLFSTHGLLGGDFSGLAEPALALSLVGNPPGVDGLLTMSEVLGLRLSADITVLSACNTAGEPETAKGGEGFAGLTRSFMFAGTRSLVVSHWPVGSQATVALMTHFFRELAKGAPKPVALSRARQQLRTIVQDGVQLAHPFFWAPFVLVGEVN